jgi:dipeptidyl aminopeptidase/acylaminoacyl peptidase
VTLSDLAQDVLAGARFLGAHPSIDPGQVGVWGISQGGRVIPIAAADSEQIAFVIAVSAPGMSPHALQLWQLDRARAAEDRARLGWDYWRWRFSQRWMGLAVRGVSDRERDPGRDWGRVTQPVLLVYGERDEVVPAHGSAQRIVRALARGGHDDYSARLFPGAEHNLWVVGGDGQVRLSAEALQAMSDWVLDRTAQRGAFARRPGTRDVFALDASNGFAPMGRYGDRTGVGSVLLLVGLALIGVTALAFVAWRWRKNL